MSWYSGRAMCMLDAWQWALRHGIKVNDTAANGDGNNIYQSINQFNHLHPFSFPSIPPFSHECLRLITFVRCLSVAAFMHCIVVCVASSWRLFQDIASYPMVANEQGDRDSMYVCFIIYLYQIIT
jgi:hypothetical protein